MLLKQKGTVPLYIALIYEDKNGEYMEPHPSTGYKRAKLTEYEIGENNLNVIRQELHFGVAKGTGYGPVTHYGVYIAEDHEHPMHVASINTADTNGLFVPAGAEAIMLPEELSFYMPPVKFTKVSAKVNLDSYSMFRVH